MKVFYHSALLCKEIISGEVLKTLPGRAFLEIQKERGDQFTDVKLNGELIDLEKSSIKINGDADLLLINNGVKFVYSVRTFMQKLSAKLASSYEQFKFEYDNMPRNEIESVCAGFLKMYAVDKCAEVSDWSDIFKKMENDFSTLKKICENPKSHLKAVNEVRPIDTVKRIGYESIPYLASHSEDWLARTASGLKPARLFSRVEEDDYHIYENRVVKTLIDEIISFLRKKLNELTNQREQLKAIINSGVQTRSFGFDVAFQKAVSEIFSSNNKYEKREKALELTKNLSRTAKKLLKDYQRLRKTRLYRYLRKAIAVSNPINETNILLMDKDYKVVFALWKNFHGATPVLQESKEIFSEQEDTYTDYLLFCKTLCGFTAHVLNFEIVNDGLYRRENDNLEISISINEIDGMVSILLSDTEKRSLLIPNNIQVPISQGQSDCGFYFDGRILSWNNSIEPDAIEQFCSLLKNRESRGKQQAEEKRRYTALKQMIDDHQRKYQIPSKSRIFIYPAIVELNIENQNSFKEYVKKNAEVFVKNHECDFIIIALPICNENEQKIIDYAKGQDEKVLILPLSMFDINSFRRIQNVLLRKIISFGKKRCPCCGGEMWKRENRLVCDNCNKLILTETSCSKCRNNYSYISFDLSTETIEKMQSVDKNNFYQADSLYQYKDIVEMNVESGKVKTICPRCHRN